MMVLPICCLLILCHLFTLVEGKDPPELVLLLTDIGDQFRSGSIYKFDIHSWNFSKIPIFTPGPYAIDYDTVKEKVYFTDISYRTINRVDLDGGNLETLMTFTAPAAPEGLTIDTNTRELFYTDYLRKVVGKFNIDNPVPAIENVIARTGANSSPRGIVADKTNKKLYWVSSGTARKIDSCDYSGLYRRTILSSSSLTKPNGIAFDDGEGRIFWTDAAGKVNSMLPNETSSDVKEHKEKILEAFLDLTILNGYMFFTSLNSKKIYAQAVDNGILFYITSSAFIQPGGLHAMSSNLNKKISCENGKHGYDCQPCGHCRNNNGCEKTTGRCFGGCQPGYKNATCTEICKAGTHGDKCGSQCGGCKNGAVCNHETGNCPNGCEPGYAGPMCTKCPTNMYSVSGDVCTPCSRCSGSASCDRKTGNCPSGCQLHWNGTRCDKKLPCETGTYGPSCTKCGKCDGGSCNMTTGACNGGCQTGYIGQFCSRINTDDPELFILLSDFGKYAGSIFRLDIHHWNLTRLPIFGISRPYALDFDPVGQHIYWTDIRSKQIRFADINGRNPQLVYTFDTESNPEGLSLDTNTRELFFTDYSHRIVGKMKMDLQPYRVEIIANLSTLSRPRGIVADKKQKKLYWVDRGTKSIDSCDYNGDNRQTLVSTSTELPNGIALDERLKKVFWTEHSGKLKSINIDGTGQTTHRDKDDQFLDITILNGYIFYTALNTSNVYAFPDDGNESFLITSQQLTAPAGIHAFSPNLNREVNCQNGFHGYECEACGKCKKGYRCEKTTGICIAGCETGYKKDHCTQACDPGTHGKDCGSECGGCKNGATCNVQTGKCPHGCDAGFFGDKCIRCFRNSYSPAGTRCIPCGRCASYTECNNQTGVCPYGCVTGWTGDRCDQKSSCPPNQYMYGNGCKPCGKCASFQVCNVTTGRCDVGCQPGWTGSKCDSTINGCAENNYKSGDTCLPCGNCAHGVCNPDTGVCKNGCQDGWKGRLCEIKAGTTDQNTEAPAVNAGLVSGVVIGVLVLLALVAVGIFLFMRYRRKRDSDGSLYPNSDNASETPSDYTSMGTINDAFKFQKF